MKMIGDIRLARFAVSVLALYLITVAALIALSMLLDFDSWLPWWAGFPVGAVLGATMFRLGIPLFRPWYTEPLIPRRPQWTEDEL